VIRLLYRYEGNAIVGHVAAVALVLWFQRSVLPASLSLSLLGAVLGCAALRAGLMVRFSRHRQRPRPDDLRLHSMIVLGCATAWSAGFIAAYDHLDPARRAFMMMVLAGLTAGSLVTLSARLRSFSLFSVTLLAPPILQLALGGGPMDFDLAVMGMLFLAFCLTGALKSSRTHSETLMKRYQNQDIMADLARTKHELELAYERSEAANQAKQRFLANVSHEVRTPLNGVLGITEMLIESGLRPEQLEQAEIVRRCGSNLLLLVNDLLDLSKIEAGKMTVESIPFEPESLLHDVATLHQATAAQRGIALRLTIEPGLPARITGDPTRLRQVLNNLVGNAIKFTDDGEVRICAGLGVRDGAAWLHMEVADDGVGIPSDRLDAIFESFVQADDSTTRKHGGTGLGLAITRELVRLMGGSVHVESTFGVGSSFRVEIPVSAEDLRAPAPAPAAATAGTEPRRYAAAGEKALRVLLAEDQDVNALILQKTLTRFHCEVLRARDGEEAVAVFQRSAPDLVILDLQMPRLDGFGAARAIRALPGGGQVPILALSAHCDAEVRAACQTAGMDDALPKPCGEARLQEALQALSGLRPAVAPSR
jgi:signal transduction histidine kinase/ActR/RegA family two-component response regulator